MSTEYENLISTLAKDVILSKPNSTYTKAETLSNLEYNLASFQSVKTQLQAIFKHDFNKLYSLEEKLKAAKFENTVRYFNKKIGKIKPSVIDLAMRLNSINESIGKLEKHKEKLLKGDEAVVAE